MTVYDETVFWKMRNGCIHQVVDIQNFAKQTKQRRRRPNKQSTTRRRISTRQLALLSFSHLFILPAIVQAQNTCDHLADTTCDWKYDKECDALSLPQCATGDCFDCDACLTFSYNCNVCVAAGCFWCPGDAVCLTQALGPEVWDLNPEKSPSCRLEADWKTTCEAVNPADNVFTDPLYDAMKWSYQLINVEQVWRDGITGAGIHVRVIDDGVDAEHDEFKVNFDVANSCEVYMPGQPLVENKHGTACASIIGGASNNNVCAAGIAPDVTLSACGVPSDLDGATATFMVHLEVVDVISNSWGPLPCKNILQTEQRQYHLDKLQQTPCPFSSEPSTSPCTICGPTFADVLTEECEKAITDYCSRYYELDPNACGEYLDLYVSCDFYALSPVGDQNFAKAVQEGRGGKGVIITFAGGVCTYQLDLCFYDDDDNDVCMGLPEVLIWKSNASAPYSNSLELHYLTIDV